MKKLFGVTLALLLGSFSAQAQQGTISQPAAAAGGGLTVGTTTITSGTTTRILYDNAGTLGEYTVSGSGTAVCLVTSCAMVTPTLGVAAGTSLALGGATIGTNALAVTGTSLLSGAVTLGSDILVPSSSRVFFSTANTSNGYILAGTAPALAAGGTQHLVWSGSFNGISISKLAFDLANIDVILSRAAAATLRFGDSDAASPVAQTLKFQDVVAGTSNTAGVNATILAPAGTGTGVGGSLIFRVAPAGSTGTAKNAQATALTIDSTKLATFAAGITASGSVVAAVKSNLFGLSSGTAATGSVALADANIQLYNNSSTNWAGVGTDNSGIIWFKVGTSGTPVPVMYLDPSTQSVIVQATTAATSTATGALQVAGGMVASARVWFPALTTSAGLQQAVLCQASTGEVIADSVACLASSEDAKNVLGPSNLGLQTVMALGTIDYQYKDTGNQTFDDAPNHRMIRAGFSAEEAAKVDSRLVALDANGKVRTIVPDSMLAALWSTVREQQGQIEELKRRLH